MGGEPRARDVARDALERRITGGEVPSGVPLDETRLARELGVDRAAVREALAGLERDGLTRADGDGFVVAPLDEAWLREAYPIALLLEGLAVRSAPRLDAGALEHLRVVNEEFRTLGPTSARVAAERDFDFHDALVVACGNERLVSTLRPMKRMLVRYECAFMQESDAVARSAAMHDEIIGHLAAGDHEAAAVVVEDNFRSALPRLLAQLARA